ncbi:MAG: CoA transferase, partial [Candidatus Rokubacteria bacterium]|nr:CoA transferase [Candidatus Rokubacteria bacterium]
VVPHDHYQTRDGKWLAIACTNDRMFERLLQALGREELRERYLTMADRLRRRAELEQLVQGWVASQDAGEALARLEAAEVPCSLVYSVRDLFEDPHIKARENIVAVPSPLGGLLHMVGVVPKLSRTPGRILGAGPVKIGEHNEEIYLERLGLSHRELKGLRARGVV